VPVLQISEIFALGGACPDNAALSLLAEKAVPLHIFDNKTYEGSWMPYMSILSGQVSMAQYMVLFDKDLTLKIAQEIVRGACRLRCSVARKWFRKDADMWESKYLDCLSKIYTKSAPSEKVIREILELDYERITTYLSDIDWYAFAEGIAKATVVSAFSRLSLDPWINALSIMDPCFAALWDDLFFLFKPLMVDLWLPVFNDWSGDMNEVPDLYRKHFSKIFAQDGQRVWSLRMLPVREGYALISNFLGNSTYRAARRVMIPKDGD